jgi:hypothetical protein
MAWAADGGDFAMEIYACDVPFYRTSSYFDLKKSGCGGP